MNTDFGKLNSELQTIDDDAGESNIRDRLTTKDELKRASETWGKVCILSILAQLFLDHMS